MMGFAALAVLYGRYMEHETQIGYFGIFMTIFSFIIEVLAIFYLGWLHKKVGPLLSALVCKTLIKHSIKTTAMIVGRIISFAMNFYVKCAIVSVFMEDTPIDEIDLSIYLTVNVFYSTVYGICYYKYTESIFSEARIRGAALQVAEMNFFFYGPKQT
jgi:hypothetical protein